MPPATSLELTPTPNHIIFIASHVASLLAVFAQIAVLIQKNRFGNFINRMFMVVCLASIALLISSIFIGLATYELERDTTFTIENTRDLNYPTLSLQSSNNIVHVYSLAVMVLSFAYATAVSAIALGGIYRYQRICNIRKGSLAITLRKIVLILTLVQFVSIVIYQCIFGCERWVYVSSGLVFSVPVVLMEIYHCVSITLSICYTSSSVQRSSKKMLTIIKIKIWTYFIIANILWITISYDFIAPSGTFINIALLPLIFMLVFWVLEIYRNWIEDLAIENNRKVNNGISRVQTSDDVSINSDNGKKKEGHYVHVGQLQKPQRAAARSGSSEASTVLHVPDDTWVDKYFE